MEKNLKKDIFNYLISIIIPGAVNFFSIPIIKWLLKAEGYGEYALWFNAFLIVISGSVSWLGMSIVRFRAEFQNADFFYRNIGRIVLWLALSLFFLSLVMVASISHKPVFALLFAIAMMISVFQNSIMAVSQANFLSKYMVYSETLRTLSFFICCISLLWISTTYYLEKIFLSLAISYLVSLLFLKSRNKISIKNILRQTASSELFPFKTFFRFGVPLVFWYFCSTSIPYMDKLLVARKFGSAVQGNYQAVFDMIYRAVGILIVPVLTASFPYLTRMYNDGENNKVFALLKRLLLIEAGLMLFGIIVYYAGAGCILMRLLNIPEADSYIHIGAFVLVIAFIWQMAMLLHKPFELMKRTDLILRNIIIALIVTVLTLIFIYLGNVGFVWYPAAIFAGSFSYAVLCFIQVKQLRRTDLKNRSFL